MDAIVLAGGYATRLWPITRNRPKMLLPVGDSTVIDRILTQLEEEARVDDVYVSTNELFAEEFESHIEARGLEKAQLSVESTADEDEKFGVVGALAQLVDREGLGDEDLLVVAGDNLMGFHISEFIDYFESFGDPTLAAYDVGDLEKAKSYGLVQLEDDQVVDFQEKPEDPKSTLVSIACYALPSDSILFDEYLSGDNNPDEPGWFLQWLVDRGTLRAFSFEDDWYDIGEAENYLEAVAWELDGEALVADDATVEDSTLGSNVHVLDGAHVADSHLENCVVFPEAHIEGSDLHDSIVDREAHVANLDSSGALVGAHSEIVNEN